MFQSIMLVDPRQNMPDVIRSLESSSNAVSAHICAPYLTTYIKTGRNNDPAEVLKLQHFLQKYDAPDLALTSVYDAQTRAAVMQFQTTYLEDVMGPWNTKIPSGYVFKTTLKKINELYCGHISAPITSSISLTPSTPLASTKTCPYFTKRLIFNSQNTTEVPKVQKFLKAQGFLDQAHALGSVVDKDTVAAIKEFQKKYASSILTPNGVLDPTGYWIESSIKEANVLMQCR